jgi:hypothetical protein
MSQKGLISFLNLLPNDITVHKNLKPKLMNPLIGEIVVLSFLLLFSE